MASDARSHTDVSGPQSSVGGNGNGSAPPSAPGKGHARLESWKDIAAYFRRDIRTVQLWEKKESLPVHRHEHAGRPSVYAFPEELDAWLRARAPSPPHVVPGSVTRPAAQPGHFRRFLSATLLFTGVAVLIAIGVTMFARHRQRTAASPVPLSGPIAVLPFEDRTSHDTLIPGAPSDFLVDGLTDDLITDLGRGGQLQVISSHSVMRLKGSHEPLPHLAAALHAGIVLEGEVAHENGDVRITARLIDAAHDRQLWAATFSRHAKNIIALQDEVAAAIATGVTETLTGSAPGVNFPGGPVAPAVRIATLTGRYLWNQRNEPDMRRAIDQFNQAIALDPNYAPAWAGLADSYNLMAVWGKMDSAEAFPQARAAAERALTLDPSSAEAWNSLAFTIYRYDWEFARADEDFRKAIAADPNYAVAHQWYGEFLGDLRRFDESIAELRRARELDPLSAMVGCDLADGYFHAGRYVEATAEINRVLALYPNFIPAHSYLSAIAETQGDLQRADQEAAIYSNLTGDPLPRQLMHIRIEARTRQLAQARSDLDAVLATPAAAARTAYAKATDYFGVGEDDAGYAALEQAYRDHSWWLVTLMVDPGFTSVRTQPRFIAIEKRVGLPVLSTTAGH